MLRRWFGEVLQVLLQRWFGGVHQVLFQRWLTEGMTTPGTDTEKGRSSIRPGTLWNRRYSYREFASRISFFDSNFFFSFPFPFPCLFN